MRRGVPLLCLLLACQGEIGGLPDFDAGPRADAPVRRDVGEPPACGEAGVAILFFERVCAGCHQGSRAYPDLTRAGLPSLASLESRRLPGERLLVPGDPEASFLYRKMAHTQGAEGGANMPLGRASPVEELATIEAWIRDGASTDCDDLRPPDVPYDPNALDPEALFACEAADAPRSSPARLRRVERAEFTQVAMNGYNNQARVQNNPMTAPEGLPYSTYTDGVGMDPATLNLLMLHLPEATVAWSTGDPAHSGGARMNGIYRTSTVACLDADPPTDECIDGYVDTLLRRGVLFRAPRPDEHARLRAYLVGRLADEAGLGRTRQETVHEVAQAAMLMTGAVFRPELGSGEPAGPRPLSDEELALALGHLLSTTPPRLPFRADHGFEIVPGDPDVAMPELGRLHRVALAAQDGTIQDPDVRVALFRHYAGGVDPDRPDLRLARVPPDSLANRGAHWLAPRLIGFFREWFDYGRVASIFKDHPAETSAFPSDGGQYDNAVIAWSNLLTSANGRESTLVDQLDDLIARVVHETDASGEDVFEALLTTRLYRIPSNSALVNDTPCAERADCSGSEVCADPFGRCAANIWRSSYGMGWPYGVAGEIPDTPEARWREMPAEERMGVLTHPAWLAAHAANFEDDANIVLRGKWIRTEIFCQSFGDLSDVQGLQAMLVEAAPELRARDRVRMSTEPGGAESSEQCFGCHQYMNSLGYPFELFNHAGYLRAEDHGHAPDGSTVVDNLPDPALNRAYATPFEFLQAIATSRYARRGMIRHAFRYFLGRDETLADGCTLVEMEAALDATGSFLSMMEALVRSESFSHRAPPAPAEEDGT